MGRETPADRSAICSQEESILDTKNETFARLPEAPASRPLVFEDQAMVDAMLSEFAPGTSEMTFTNLLTWKSTHPVELARHGQTLILWRGPAENGLLLPPLGPVLDRDGVRAALALATAHGGPARFGRVPEPTAQMLVEADPTLEMFAEPDHADYVYRQEDLGKLAGRKFDGKRNLVSRFERAVQAEFRELTPDLVAECLEMQRHWCEEKGCSEHPDLDAEDQAVFRTLEMWDRLPVVGGALVLEETQRVIAFSVAECLTADTAVIHFEKGTTRYPGVYQMINKSLCERLLGGYAWINREQDLGVPGLRKAKQSYHPAHMVEKFTVRAKGDAGQ
jgi:uncharacterized protein